MGFGYLMTDHPGWQTDGTRYHRLVVADTGDLWLAGSSGTELSWASVIGQSMSPPLEVFAVPTNAAPQAAPIHAPLTTFGTVGRLRNLSLWDALATAIVRQVVRAAQARKLYRDFAGRYGPSVAVSGEMDIHSFPSPERVLALSDEAFTESGMAFKRRTLRHAAEAFLAHGAYWQEVTPSVLVKELQVVPGIGPWSAGAAVADWSNDWTVYPYGDLAVRTWAQRANPDYPWPIEEAAFSRVWRRVTGEHLATYTLLTLASGCRRGGTI
ncbi:hypothetical protein ACGFIW_28220 [Micromonospora sp. NPDC048935]|uniref:hypothetical protein n=1 Tax=Micromonospora sp. NPDC048935 TaxID=3364262 RepID=UPI0037106059